MIHEGQHACRICEKMLRHDAYFIRGHVSSAHNETLATYYLRYMLSEKDQREFSAILVMRRHITFTITVYNLFSLK